MREPGHYYTAYFVSLASGFGPSTALRNAVFAQMPDEVNALDATFQEESRLGAPGGMVTWTRFERDLIQRGLHSLTGGLSDTERNVTKRAIRQATPGTMDFGFLLHRFGDTYAHSVIGNETRMYDTGWGHALDLNDPDFIHVRPGLYVEFVRELYGVLSELALGQGLVSRMSVEQVLQVARGVPNPTTRTIPLDTLGGAAQNVGPSFGEPRGYTEIVVYDSSESAQIRRLRDCCRQQMRIELDPYRPEDEETMSWVQYKRRHAPFMHQLDGAEITWPGVATAVFAVARSVGQVPRSDLNYPLRPQ